MPPETQNKKSSLQSVVDSIQTQASRTNGVDKGYVPNPNLKSLRTFQGDMQEHIEVKQETVATIALAEQKKKIEHDEPTYTEREPKTHSGLFIIIGTLCLVAGGLVFGGLYFLKTEMQPTSTKTVVEKTLLPYTQKKDITLNTLDTPTFASALLQEQTNTQAEINSALYTKFTYQERVLTRDDFISLIVPQTQDALKRNILEVMPGIFSYDTNEIFFALKPDEFGIVYSEMLKSENTLAQNLSLFFPGLRQHLSVNPALFTDETYKNKDVRVIRNDAGKIVFLYGFLDKETLLITANERIFEAILIKYTQSKLSR